MSYEDYQEWLLNGPQSEQDNTDPDDYEWEVEPDDADYYV